MLARIVVSGIPNRFIIIPRAFYHLSGSLHLTSSRMYPNSNFIASFRFLKIHLLHLKPATHGCTAGNLIQVNELTIFMFQKFFFSIRNFFIAYKFRVVNFAVKVFCFFKYFISYATGDGGWRKIRLEFLKIVFWFNRHYCFCRFFQIYVKVRVVIV